MTTIVYKDGIIASDTFLSNGVKSGEVNKIIIANLPRKTTCVAAGSGTWSSVTRFHAWVQEGMNPKLYPSFTEDFRGMLALKSYNRNIILHYDSSSDYKGYTYHNPFYAMGSGYELALGAMAAGATAIEAIEIACDYDLSTNRPIQYVDLTALKIELLEID